MNKLGKRSTANMLNITLNLELASHPREKYGIKDACRRVLEHFGHTNHHIYLPGFFSVTLEFQATVHCEKKRMQYCFQCFLCC